MKLILPNNLQVEVEDVEKLVKLIKALQKPIQNPVKKNTVKRKRRSRNLGKNCVRCGSSLSGTSKAKKYCNDCREKAKILYRKDKTILYKEKRTKFSNY
jgi:hypothetical protein